MVNACWNICAHELRGFGSLASTVRVHSGVGCKDNDSAAHGTWGHSYVTWQALALWHSKCLSYGWLLLVVVPCAWVRSNGIIHTLRMTILKRTQWLYFKIVSSTLLCRVAFRKMVEMCTPIMHNWKTLVRWALQSHKATIPQIIGYASSRLSPWIHFHRMSVNAFVGTYIK